jgi:tRNA nucleotidyltransferase (CCA-adding enzyme)
MFPATLVLAVALDNWVEAMFSDKLLSAYTPLINRYLNPDDLVAHPTPLVSGKELIIALDIPASPIIGKLLAEIAVAKAEGKVATVEEAIAYARQLLHNIRVVL